MSEIFRMGNGPEELQDSRNGLTIVMGNSGIGEDQEVYATGRDVVVDGANSGRDTNVEVLGGTGDVLNGGKFAQNIFDTYGTGTFTINGGLGSNEITTSGNGDNVIDIRGHENTLDLMGGFDRVEGPGVGAFQVSADSNLSVLVIDDWKPGDSLTFEQGCSKVLEIGSHEFIAAGPRGISIVDILTDFDHPHALTTLHSGVTAPYDFAFGVGRI